MFFSPYLMLFCTFKDCDILLAGNYGVLYMVYLFEKYIYVMN